jgi:hypothetical protein
MMMFLFIMSILCRSITIPANNSLNIYDFVTKNDIYKFIYSTRSDVVVELKAPDDSLIIKTSDKSANLFACSNQNGKIQIKITNKSSLPATFFYKCPDPNKELIGHLGYIKDTDYITELTSHLNELITEQNAHIERVKQQQLLVESSRRRSRLLIAVECILTIIAAYLMHRDFISMFEKKQTL